ncbi:MAG: peptidylprolyl isomerase [Nevskiales bacterium]
MRVLSSLLPLLVGLSLSAALHAAAEPLDRIVAVVNEELVLESELDAALGEVVRQMKSQGASVADVAALRRQVLERLILTRLQTDRAKRAGMEPSEADVNQALGGIAERNQLSLDQLPSALAQDGIDYAAYREQIRNEILLSRLRQKEVESRISVSEQDVALMLESEGQQPVQQREYQLRHILIAVPTGASAQQLEQARAEAVGVLRKLEQGANFAELAIASSDGQQAVEGGDLGWIASDVLPTAFAETVPRLKPGQTSPVLEGGNAFHIVRLEAVRDANPRPQAQQVRARHILLRPNDKRDAEQTAARIRELHQRLAEGADFSQLAEQHSDDPGSRKQGGDLGWQAPSSFDPDFRAQLEKLEVKQLSAPFQTGYGWHIAQLLERRDAAGGADSERREAAYAALRRRRVNEEYDIWLRRLRDEAYVEIRLGKEPPTKPIPAAGGKQS